MDYEIPWFTYDFAALREVYKIFEGAFATTFNTKKSLKLSFLKLLWSLEQIKTSQLLFELKALKEYRLFCQYFCWKDSIVIYIDWIIYKLFCSWINKNNYKNLSVVEIEFK